jgi:hypothetical protein
MSHVWYWIFKLRDRRKAQSRSAIFNKYELLDEKVNFPRGRLLT